MSISHCILFFLFFFFFFFLASLTALSPSSSLSFDFPASLNSSTVAPDLTPFGDAVISAVELQLTSHKQWSAGRVVVETPVKFFTGNRKPKSSFSAYISFRCPNSGGAVLDFSLLPARFPFDSLDMNVESRVFSLEFGDFSNSSSVDSGVSNLVSVKSSTDSVLRLSLNSKGEKIHCWIEYKAAADLLEVKLSRSSKKKPSVPSVSQQIYLFTSIKEEEKEEEDVFVALSCWNGNSTETCEVFSWSFKLRVYPPWLHSQPLFPQALHQKDGEQEGMSLRKKAGCILRFFGALVLGAGCGAVVATVGLLLWAAFVPGKQQIVAEETVTSDCGYEKIRVVLGKGSSSDGNSR